MDTSYGHIHTHRPYIPPGGSSGSHSASSTAADEDFKHSGSMPRDRGAEGAFRTRLARAPYSSEGRRTLPNRNAAENHWNPHGTDDHFEGMSDGEFWEEHDQRINDERSMAGGNRETAKHLAGLSRRDFELAKGMVNRPLDEEDYLGNMHANVKRYEDGMQELAKLEPGTPAHDVKSAELKRIRSDIDSDMQKMNMSEQSRQYAEQMLASDVMNQLQTVKGMNDAMNAMKLQFVKQLEDMIKMMASCNPFG